VPLTRVTLAESEDAAIEVGRDLLDMADEVDGLLEGVYRHY